MLVDFVKKIMKSKGLKSYSLAKAIGVTTTTAQKWAGESGQTPPSGMQFKSLIRLQELSGMEEGEFFRMLKREFKDKT